MSFAKGEQVMKLVEGLLMTLWYNLVRSEIGEGTQVKSPFPRMTYQDAMSMYGSDKPDIRLGMEVRSLLSLLRSILTFTDP